MEKIFFAENSVCLNSISLVEWILSNYFGIKNPQICRTNNGKPYLNNPENPIFFSISHTKTGLFIAFSDKNVGIDAEKMDRKVNYQPILSKFPIEERKEINSGEDFLLHWTVKESAVKFLGGTLAHDLNRMSYIHGVLRYDNLELPIQITTLRFQGHILSICAEKDFSNTEFISL